MTKPKLHLICNAHLDPVWQWQWEEGCSEALSTFRNAVKILKEDKNLIFNHNEAVLYKWILKYDPALFIEIQKLVLNKRWFISGGWYLQPDVNIPGTESLIRQIIEGKKFFRKYFNSDPVVAYNFDSFGHSGGLPQILVKSGYKMYIHMRPQENDLHLPSDLYIWEGVDGSRIAALRIAVGLYHTEYENIEQRLNEGIELALKLNRDVPVFWGIGDHGGGASREDLKIISHFINKEKHVKIIYSTPDNLYRSLKNKIAEAPVVKGDLQRVFTGCYTSLSKIKRASQESLAKIIQAEMLASAAWWKYGNKYPVKEFQNIWYDHLFNDFHDILPGTCIEPAEKDALNLYGKIKEETRRINLLSVADFNKGRHQSYYIPITVLNTSHLQEKLPVEFECMISHRPKWHGKWHLKLFDINGKEIISQEEQPETLLPFNGWRRKLSFMADFGSVGFNHFYAEAFEGEKERKIIPSKVNFNLREDTGLISSLMIGNFNCLNGLLFEPLVIEDEGDSWGTDLWNYRKIKGKFVCDKNSFRLIEYGEVRKIYESIFEYGKSKIVFRTVAYFESDILEFRLRIHWNEERCRLKLAIPTSFNVNSVLCEVPGGEIQRPTDGNEHVIGRWFFIEENNKALTVINNGQHGLDFKEGEIRISVLRSAAYCHEKNFTIEEYPYRKFSDIGIHEVRFYILAGESNSIKTRISALADYLLAPPVVYPHLPIGKNNGDGKEFLKITPANIRILAIKKSETAEALIIRLQECAGISTRALININSLKTHLNFKPLEIKTLRLNKKGSFKEVNLISEN